MEYTEELFSQILMVRLVLYNGSRHNIKKFVGVNKTMKHHRVRLLAR